jgi:hypothetical protein
MVSYPISFPMANLHSYTSNVSFRGISLEFNQKVGPGRTAGLEAGWNVFYQHVDTKVYTEGTQSITGAQFRYTNSFPIIAGMKIYPQMQNKIVRPYLGLGLGTVYVHRETDFGLYRITSDAWQFCIRPEAGVEFRTSDWAAFFIGAKYYWDFSANGLDAQPYLSANIGVKLYAF